MRKPAIGVVLPGTTLVLLVKRNSRISYSYIFLSNVYVLIIVEYVEVSQLLKPRVPDFGTSKTQTRLLSYRSL